MGSALCVRLEIVNQILGFMRVFFKKMGMTDVRFKPAYNPYTEVRTMNPQWRPGFDDR